MRMSELYRPLWEDEDSNYFIIIGGRGSGKSFAAADFLENQSFEEKHKVLYTRYTMTSAHDSIIPEFREKIELEGHEGLFKINKADIRNLRTGSSILFRGIMTSSGNQTARLKSIKGLTTFVLDEGEELVVEKMFDTIDESVREKGNINRTIIVMNPATWEHWIYTRFFEPHGLPDYYNGKIGNVRYIHTNYLNNLENLSQKFIDGAEKMKETNFEEYEHRYLGKWKDREEGVIYTNWRIAPFDESLPYGYGEDFGFSSGMDALVKVAIDEKRQRIYLKEEIYQNQNSSRDLIDMIKARGVGHSLIMADSEDQRLIREQKNSGLNVREVSKPAGSVSNGIKIMQGYELCVDPESINLINELKHYKWKDEIGKIPAKGWDHLLDAARYYVMTMTSSYRKTKLL